MLSLSEYCTRTLTTFYDCFNDVVRKFAKPNHVKLSDIDSRFISFDLLYTAMDREH